MKTLIQAFFFSTLLAIPPMAHAVKLPDGAKQIEGVTLSNTTTTADGKTLNLVGAGLRAKKVVMVNVNVYVAELYAADVSKFKKSETEALGSITAAQPLAIRMSFLRDVDAEKVQKSFHEALEANKVDLNKPEIKAFLEGVKNGGEAKKNKTLKIVGSIMPDGKETVTYEDANGKVVTTDGTKGFVKDIFSIWLGKPSDSGVAQLKSSLLK